MATVATAVYANAINGSFVSDDHALIVYNRALREPTPWWVWFGRNYYWDTALTDRTLYRPLTMLTYVATFRLAGAAAPAFHVGNVVLHAIVSLLVLAVGRRMVGSRAALWGALLFAVHPLHTEAVAWAAGRAELLAAAGALVTVLGLLCATERGVRAPLLYALTAGSAYLAALLSKEHVALLPLWGLLLVLLDRQRRRLRQLALVAAGLISAAAIYLALRQISTVQLTGSQGDVSLFNPTIGRPVVERWLTASAVVARYAALFLWPADLSVDYSFASTLPSQDVWIRELAGIALIVGTPIAIAVLARCALGPALSLSLVPTTFLIVSNIPFPIGTIMAERVTYLPTVGLCLLAGWVMSRIPARRLAVTALGITILTSLTARTMVRNLDWQDSHRLYQAAALVSPRSATVQNVLADLKL